MLTSLLLLSLVPQLPSNGAAAVSVLQSARRLPVAKRVDVVIVGGTVGATAAATEAAKSGASVLLVAPRTYLGEDLCSTLQLWLEPGETARGNLARRLFREDRTTTPLKVKRTLERELIAAKVDFLLASLPAGVLRDEAGRMAGVVIANRAGRQAIIAKIVVDATDTGVVARLAKADMQYVTDSPPVCRRVVLGGEPVGSLLPVREVPGGVSFQDQPLSYFVYELQLPLDEDRFDAWAEVEQRLRDSTYREGQLRASEHFFAVTGKTIHGRVSAGAWSNEPTPAIGHFCPQDVERLYVIGGAADVPRSIVPSLLRPDAQESLGRRIGREAARRIREIGQLKGVHEQAEPAPPTRRGGDILESLTGLRAVKENGDTIASPEMALPVLADVDVVVVGGGTSGACAAISAARRGAKVLVAEYQEGLGGVGTLGLIGKPYHGLDRGFTAEVPFPDEEHNLEYKMEWFRRRIRELGGQIWFSVVGCGAYMENGSVRGAVIATPLGRGVVLARAVIDATGNADIAAAAGAETMYGGDSTGIALQGTGLPHRPLGGRYVNTDYLLVDEADMIDTWRAFVGARMTGEMDGYDMGPFLQTRERRRVVGDHVMSYLDQIAGRTYPDSIVLSGSDYDSHGYPSEPYFALIPHTAKTLQANHPAPGGMCYTPYRCLLPRGVEGMLVIGLGISMDRDASAMVRMQKDMHNQGYAAGIAAAMAAEAGCGPRQIDVRRLQQYLVDAGNLPASVLHDTDSFPLTEDQVRQAVRQYADPQVARRDRCRALAIVLTHSRAAEPMLLDAYRASRGDSRTTYAKVLAFLGRRESVPELVQALQQCDDWDPKVFQGNMAEYAHLPTPIDSLILALGYSGDPGALPVLLAWVEHLDANVTLSHHRAIALALERLGHTAAARPLAELLNKPGMRGHAMTQLEPLYNRQRDRRRREGSLREIVLARALYRCGDYDGLGREVLEEYRRDIRGLFARHAQAVLASHRGG